MNAQVFLIESQRDLFQRIKALLLDHIYNHMQVDSIVIDKLYNVNSLKDHPNCKIYLDLLKASIRRAKGQDFNINFEVVVKRDDQTDWCYLGEGKKEEKKESEKKSVPYLTVKHSGMPALFPAVAILDRMVMVPEKITRDLDRYPREFLWCPKPLDLGGVLLVDFDDEFSIKRAIKLVGVQLKSEIKKLCGRHMVANRIKRPNLEELGKLLFNDSKEEYLEYLRKEDDQLFKPAELSSAVVSSQAVVGKLSAVALEIKNKSDKSLNQVRVRVRAPAGILKKTPVSKIVDLPAHEAVTIKFQVLPKTSPYCPLEVIVDIGEDAEDIQPFPMAVILEVQDKR